MLGWDDPRPLSLVTTPDRARSLAGRPGLKTMGDALLNFPRRYVHAGSAGAMESMVVGDRYTCIGDVLTVRERDNTSMRGPRTLFTFTITDGSVRIEATLFGNPRMHRAVITPGARLMVSGTLGVFRDRWQLKNPSYLTVDPGTGEFGAFGPLKTLVDIAGSREEAARILGTPWLPTYPRRTGTTSVEVLGVMDGVLAQMGRPSDMLPAHRDAPAWPEVGGTPLIGFADALHDIHRPPEAGPAAATTRLKFNEALGLQLVMALRRADAESRTARRIPAPGATGVPGPGTAAENAPGESADGARPGGRPDDPRHHDTVRAALPFTLSPGQVDVLGRIESAMDSDQPMSMLLQGDVGSGKTVVALLAMLRAVDAGFQCAFLAPTEVLAAQHARTLTRFLDDAGETGVGVTLLTGSQSTAARKAALLDIVSGQTSIVVGTHAIIQDAVEFYDLGLVVVDEQHRFGVRQRDRLRESAPVDRTPHVLVMTATPIPRTVAMTMFGDLTSCTLEGRPHGTGRTSTSVVPAWKPTWVARAFERIREEVGAGHCAFVVAPRIEGDGGVEDVAATLSAGPLRGLRTAVLHGRMRPVEKDEAMAAMVSGDIDVLVATTVVEVGVDIPEATVMLVLDAENFGVSQLHQLRGRVGRGSADAVCLLHTEQPEDSPAFRRLLAVAGTTDGFELAELDLQARTEGDVLGEEQSGAAARRVRLLDLTTDEDIIREARRYANDLVAYDEPLARALVADIETEDQEFIERS
ncbi:ATP-dependent DNA helicase RecG [Corynebacterium bovis]|uniref:ATP-dependent DNA helicase RecG n=1 Tax=Corynebacterium bovis TaxID=36808 RepID=UPI00254D206A|nr:ATP-dependent DNA helicase RecG [Corynebacterium bovis]MDK8510280.1 ATP-dependent DNA helicase RecG [Corynebacterium bovis]